MSPASGVKRIVPVLPDKPRSVRGLPTLLDFQPYLFFFSNQRSSILPPYAPYMNADLRRDPLHPPHPIQRHASNKRICLIRGGRTKLLHRRGDRAYLDFGSN